MGNKLRKAIKGRRESALVLCEGFRTEPNYLGAIVRDLGLTSVDIPCDHDSDPLSLSKRAIVELKSRSDLAAAFVVFDRDEHHNYNTAVGLIKNHDLYNKRLFLAKSDPAFEYWLLLHFERCRSPMSREEALYRLRGHLPSYEKSDVSCIDHFIGRLDTALDNADFGNIDVRATGNENPSTDMPTLIRYLQSLAT